MNHSQLCEIAAKWLQKKSPVKCPVVMIEMKSYCPEQPDVIGFTGSESVLLEIKCSRADFKRDAKKFWREHPEMGVGDLRLYVCPTGLIQPEELPEKWGLVWIDEKGKAELINGDIFQRDKENGYKYIGRHQKNGLHERSIMYSGLRRIYNNEPLKGLN